MPGSLDRPGGGPGDRDPQPVSRRTGADVPGPTATADPDERRPRGGVVRLGGEAHDAILDHARRALPDECCGLLIGQARGPDTRIVRAWPARNLRQSRTRYLIDPADHFAALRTARRAGLAVVGVYHSHPVSPPSPSPTDDREADPGLLYVIASPARGEMRAYRVDRGRLRRVELRRTVSRGIGRPGPSPGRGRT